jgi:hypothetical protein
MIDIDFSLSDQAKQALDRALERATNADRVFAEAVREVGLEAAEQVARNLSGRSVTHRGRTFTVNVQTGNLRRSTRIIWPHNGNPLAVRIVNVASYADAVQRGQTGAQRKAALLSSGRVKTSAEGKKYIFVPVGPGKGQGFTVNEASTLNDIPPRPFLDAASEQMRSRVDTLLTDALNRAFKAD